MREPLTAPPRRRREPALEHSRAAIRRAEDIGPLRPPRAMARAAEKGNRRRALPRWARPALDAAGSVLLAALVAGGLLWTWKTGAVGSVSAELYSRFVNQSAAAGFALGEVFVEGRTATDADTVRRALAVSRGDPLLPYDIHAAQARLKELPWVLEARVERRLPDALYVWLTERQPMAIWQNDGKMTVIDAAGRALGDAAQLAARGDKTVERLPQVVGPGAAEAARDLLDMLSHVPVIERRVTAAVRVGRRRWDLTLDNRVTIRLPEENMQRALHQLAQVEVGDGVLNRDILSVDLRQADRMTVRLSDPPPEPEPAHGAKKPPPKRT